MLFFEKNLENETHGRLNAQCCLRFQKCSHESGEALSAPIAKSLTRNIELRSLRRAELRAVALNSSTPLYSQGSHGHVANVGASPQLDVRKRKYELGEQRRKFEFGTARISSLVLPIELHCFARGIFLSC